MKKSLKNKKGISLIVLVITIAVMIILAAAIILSLQSSGIIDRANEAKEKNDIASAKELVSVANSEWLLMTETKQEENGGTFVNYAESKLTDAGYNPDELVVGEDGTVEECVAMIGNEKFVTLREAVKYAKNNNLEATIKVVKDITMENKSVATISNGQTVTIDLNGHLITSIGRNTITNNGEGVLYIIDTSTEKTGMIVAKSDKSKYVEEYDINNDGVVSIEDYKPLAEHINQTGYEIEEGSEEFELYDLSNDGVIDIEDLVMYAKYNNQVYAIYCENTENVQISIGNDNIKGDPIAINIEENMEE